MEENSKLVLENDYIEWLSRFIAEHRDFNTDDIKSLFKDITKEDKDNISKLEYFYNLISEYASEETESVIPNFYLLGNYFKVKYNSNKFLIGKSSIYDSINYFCKKGFPFGKYLDFQEIQDYYLNSKKSKTK